LLGLFAGFDMLDAPITRSMGVFCIGVALVGFTLLLAIAEGVYVFLDIEENTRKTADHR
jgi:hypothetical protein